MQMMQRRLREEELRVLRGQTKVDERALDEALMAGRDDASRGKTMKRPGAASVRRDGRGGGGEDDDTFADGRGGNLYGGMTPMGDDDDDDSDDFGDEDAEGGEGSEMEGEDASSEGQVEFTHEADDDDDDLSGDDFGDEGEEDNDF